MIQKMRKKRFTGVITTLSQSEQSGDKTEGAQTSEGELFFEREAKQITFQKAVHRSAKETPGMVDDIVKYTNMYIESKRNTVSYKREKDCRDTTRCEILALIGTLFFIGTKKGSYTNVLELWATNGTGIQTLRAVMGYKRFLFLLRCLRFDDKSTRSERKQTDKLAPIRSMLDSFVRNCKNSYTVSEYVTIDEMLHPFRGRCSFVQYISSKPAKYGLKCFAMCDAKTFYTSNLEVYCKTQPSGSFNESNSPTDIVKRLVEPIEGSNRNLTTDSWYTSLPLAEYLLGKNITFFGTMRKNKLEIPPEFLPRKNRKTQSSLFGFRKQETLVSYVPKPNNAVILLSTIHDLAELDKITRIPEIVLSYNETKKAVDTMDKMCTAYSVSIESLTDGL
ncbi:piggyBac transposable element-derived protein 4-like [Temnothorax longispinosus]|uniref:piggyBac transposable element-derived protein 4-like n=1 Tax=Temnothorax longispinosus TaxID=300112 RepID=UPI003A99A9EB